MRLLQTAEDRIDCKSFNLEGRIRLYELLVIITHAPFGVSSSASNVPSILPSRNGSVRLPVFRLQSRQLIVFSALMANQAPFPTT